MSIINLYQKHIATSSIGDRLSDSVANGMGSWKFIIWQTVIVLIWMALNVIAFAQHWDPYPFFTAQFNF